MSILYYRHHPRWLAVVLHIDPSPAVLADRNAKLPLHSVCSLLVGFLVSLDLVDGLMRRQCLRRGDCVVVVRLMWCISTKTQPGLGLHSLQRPAVTTMQVAETPSLVVLPLSCCCNCCAAESVVTPPCVTVGDGQEV